MRVRLTKLRPLSGSASICSLVTVVPSSDEEVWTQRRLRLDGDRFGQRADLELEIDSDALVDAELDVGHGDRLEAGDFCGDRVVPGRQRRRGVFAIGVGHDDAGQFGAGVGERDVDAGHDSTRRIRHATDDRAGHGLRRGGRGGEGD